MRASAAQQERRRRRPLAPATQRHYRTAGRFVAKRQIIIDVNVAEEVATFDAWRERWRSAVELSDNEGCGCCVDIWDVAAPEAAFDELPPNLLAWRPS
jgi:hypothetical protein